MNTKLANNPKKLFWILMLVLLPVLVVISLDFPVNIDEPLHYAHAQKNLNWFLTGGEDQSCFNTGKTNLEHYAQSADNITALVNHVFNVKNQLQSRHVIGALYAWLLLLFIGLSAFELTANYWVSRIAVLLVLITPSIMGQYCNNLKDIPFAMGYAMSTWASLRFLRKLPYPSWKDALLLGIAIAVLNSVRMGGVVFIPYLLLFTGLWFFLNRKRHNKHSGGYYFKKPLFKLVIAILIGYFGSMIFWPYALAGPLSHPIESLKMMSNYIVSIRQNFESELVWSTHLPDYYLPKWLFISIPEVIWIGLLIGAMMLIDIFHKNQYSKSQFIAFSFVLFSLLFPVFHVIRINSNMYCGWRQFYFLIVPIGILAATSLVYFFRLIKQKGIQILLIASFTILLIMPLRNYARGMDLSYVYFNNMAKGNNTAWGNYEYDYYFHAAKRSSEWFFSNIRLNDTIVVASDFDIRIYNSDSAEFQYHYSKYDSRSYSDWDYGLFSVNYLHPYRLKNNTWQTPGIIKTFYHAGNPVAFIIKRNTSADFRGLKLLKEKQHKQAIPFLTSALEHDKNNIVLYGALSHAWLQTDNIAEAKETISDGLKVNPKYEYLLLQDAKISFAEMKYKESLTKCKNIVDINPKYYDVCVLMARCYDKLGQAEKARQVKKYYKSIMSY